MKRIISLVMATLVLLSSCAATPFTTVSNEGINPTTTSEGEKPAFMLDATYDAINSVCRDASFRIEVDRNEDVQKLCRERIIIFFRMYPQKIWMDLAFIHDVALGIVYRWSDENIRTYLDAYGCYPKGCTIVVNNFPAGHIKSVVEEEMIKQGKKLYSDNYIVPPL